MGLNIEILASRIFLHVKLNVPGVKKIVLSSNNIDVTRREELLNI